MDAGPPAPILETLATMNARLAVLLCLLALGMPAYAVRPAVLVGTWEAARGPDDERMFVRLMDKGRAEIVAEYDFQLPGQPGKRRGRSTTFAKWSVKGDDITIAYAKVRDRLRYSDKQPLSEIGLDGNAAALKPTAAPDPKSRIRVTLWKAPHEYRVKPAEQAQVPAEPPAK
jgi:hypothetical protein